MDRPPSSSSSLHHPCQHQPPPNSAARPIQGPRPPPLRIHKDSHKIRKLPRTAATSQYPHQQQQLQRGPVIIYAVSPKIIRAEPSEFMSLVQRLTGMDRPAGASTAPPSLASHITMIARAQQSSSHQRPSGDGPFDADATAVRGILSPNPTSLPALSPGLFLSPLPELNSLGYLQEFLGNMSPAGPFLDRTVPSPCWNLFVSPPQINFDHSNPFPHT